MIWRGNLKKHLVRTARSAAYIRLYIVRRVVFVVVHTREIVLYVIRAVVVVRVPIRAAPIPLALNLRKSRRGGFQLVLEHIEKAVFRAGGERNDVPAACNDLQLYRFGGEHTA